MTPIDRYLAGKWCRPVPQGSPQLAEVLGSFQVDPSVGHLRTVDLATLDNSIEIVRLGGETALVFDHNYFAYVGDLLTCFLAQDDDDAQHQHLNYVINRFLLEESLQFNADALTAGLLHVVLLQDQEGLNPLGDPGFADAKQLRSAQARIRDFQFRLFVAHEVGHVLAHDLPNARAPASRRLRHLLDGLTGQATTAPHPENTGSDHADHEMLVPSATQLRSWLHALDTAQPVDLLLEEFLCDNLAAEALGSAAARSGAKLGLVADDLMFAIESVFLLMWFLEALRFRLAALFDDERVLSDTGPEVARTRGHYFTFQFLLSFLGGSGTSVEDVRQGAQEAAARSDALMAWLSDNLKAAQSDDNLESVARLGARSAAAYGLSGGRLHAAATGAGLARLTTNRYALWDQQERWRR